jgi:colicin import membrane protein
MRRLIISFAAILAVALPIATLASSAEASPRSQAVGTAQDYLSYSAFSKAGLVDQLMFEGFSRSVATYAVNHIRVSWKQQAVKSAKSYLSYSHFSCSGLIEQLDFEKFTHSQSVYGARHTSAC